MGESMDRLRKQREEALVELSMIERVRSYFADRGGKRTHVSGYTRKVSAMTLAELLDESSALSSASDVQSRNRKVQVDNELRSRGLVPKRQTDDGPVGAPEPEGTSWPGDPGVEEWQKSLSDTQAWEQGPSRKYPRTQRERDTGEPDFESPDYVGDDGRPIRDDRTFAEIENDTAMGKFQDDQAEAWRNSLSDTQAWEQGPSREYPRTQREGAPRPPKKPSGQQAAYMYSYQQNHPDATQAEVDEATFGKSWFMWEPQSMSDADLDDALDVIGSYRDQDNNAESEQAAKLTAEMHRRILARLGVNDAQYLAMQRALVEDDSGSSPEREAATREAAGNLSAEEFADLLTKMRGNPHAVKILEQRRTAMQKLIDAMRLGANRGEGYL